MATPDQGFRAEDSAKVYLDLAAKIASRAAGDVEPNPMVGAVIVKDGRIIGMGHHKKYGGLHAEREALADCRRRGEDPRGSTVYVTLEPCCHHGKQPPCTDALIEAGVARVIAARPDPNPVSHGGAGVLARAGIACEFSDASPNAIDLAAPFIKRITTRLPWVIAKWAQTTVGRLITEPGEPRWISGPAARRRVHALRARVDAVITGTGTILADDPRLTARGVARIRRVARRVVLDSALRIAPVAQVIRTAREVPTVVLCIAEVFAQGGANRLGLESMGAEVIPCDASDGRIEPRAALELLAERFNAAAVLLESGRRLLASFFAAGCVDEAIVHIGSARLDEEQGRAAAERVAPVLADRRRHRLCRVRPLGADTELIYRVV